MKKDFDITYLGHNFYFDQNWICEKCGCIAHIGADDGVYRQRIRPNYNFRWIDLLSCADNIIKYIIE